MIRCAPTASKPKVLRIRGIFLGSGGKSQRRQTQATDNKERVGHIVAENRGINSEKPENRGSGKSSAISAPRGATKKEKPMIEQFLFHTPSGIRNRLMLHRCSGSSLKMLKPLG